MSERRLQTATSTAKLTQPTHHLASIRSAPAPAPAQFSIGVGSDTVRGNRLREIKTEGAPIPDRNDPGAGGAEGSGGSCRHDNRVPVLLRRLLLRGNVSVRRRSFILPHVFEEVRGGAVVWDAEDCAELHERRGRGGKGESAKWQ